jgi:parallel beta-helix repeat protein
MWRMGPVTAAALLLLVVFSPYASVHGTLVVRPPEVGLSTSQEYTESEFIIIQNNLQLSTVASSGSGTEADPYIISNLKIESYTPCIRVYNTTAWFVIRDCDLRTPAGIPSSEAVVQLSSLRNGAIEDCYMTGATNGVQMMSVIDCQVIGCRSFDNVGNGVYLYGSSNCTVISCHLYANQKGIMFEASSYCEVRGNTIYRNTYVGVEFEPYSHDNSVVANNFGWNFVRETGETHVRDSGENNTFDDGMGLGNAYSDYDGSPPYLMSGDAGSADHYPMSFGDSIPPTIEHLADFAFDKQVEGNYATWAASDTLPYTYVAYINAVAWRSGIWDGREIRLLIDGIAIGTHNLTMVVTDCAGNSARDVVFVTAVNFVFAGLGTPLVMIASGITVLSFLLVLGLIKKFY